MSVSSCRSSSVCGVAVVLLYILLLVFILYVVKMLSCASMALARLVARWRRSIYLFDYIHGGSYAYVMPFCYINLVFASSFVIFLSIFAVIEGRKAEAR